MQTSRILELDGLRAFAVLGVIAFHMNGWSGAIPNTNPIVNHLIECFGPAGVLVFFIISGYIITSLLLREKQKTGSVNLLAFYIRRFFRIVPPLAFYLLGLVALTYSGYITVNPLNYLYSLLFITNFGLLVAPGKDFLVHTWTLSIEEQYYIFLPPIMVLALGFRKRPINILLIVLFVLCLISLPVATRLGKWVHPALTQLAVFYKFRFIILGVLIALHQKRIRPYIAGRSRLFPILMLTTIFAIYYFDIPAPFNLLSGAAEAIAWGLFVFWFVENPDKCGFLRWSMIQWIGTCSYSIYLWQQLFTCAPEHYHQWTFTQSFVAIIPIFICGAISNYLIEKPTIRLGRYFSQKRTTNAAIVAS